MRLTVFWERMHGRFGAAYSGSLAHDLVMAALGGRTIDEALAAGLEPGEVWRAVCEALDVPVEQRH